VSISPKSYARLFRTKALREAFLYLDSRFVLFWRKNIGVKAVRKILVKLTPDLKIIDNLLKTYDRRATPTNKFGKPTQVGCELFIRSFGSISEKTMVSLITLLLNFGFIQRSSVFFVTKRIYNRRKTIINIVYFYRSDFIS
jgi:hypothetical protein